MNYKNPENIIFYSLVSCVALVFATAARFYLLQNIKDVFTANVIFIVAIILIVAGYITILLVTKDFLIPYIGKLLLKIPSIRKKRQNIDDEKYRSELQNSTIVETTPNLDSVREEHRQKEEERKRQLLEITIQYAQETFAPYTSDENISIICQAVTDYCDSIEVRVEKSVSVKDLSNGDLFHFGWNIWNRLQSVRKSKLEDIAIFLKVVFEKQLRDVEIETIRKKMKFNEGKFKIKLEK